MQKHYLIFPVTFTEMESHCLTFPVTCAGTESSSQWPVQRWESITWSSLWPLQRWKVTIWPSLWPLQRWKVTTWPSLWPLQRWKVTNWPSLWPVLKSAAVGIHLSAAWVHPHPLHLSCLQEHSGSAAWVRPDPCYICLVCRNTVGWERTAPTTLYRASTFNDWPHLTAVYWLVSWLNGRVVVCVVNLTDRLILFCVVLCVLRCVVHVKWVLRVTCIDCVVLQLPTSGSGHTATCSADLAVLSPTPPSWTWSECCRLGSPTSRRSTRPDLAPGSPDTLPTPWPCTRLPEHPANTLTLHLAPRTPRQHPDLTPGSPNTPPTPQHSTRPDLSPDTPPTPWPGTWSPDTLATNHGMSTFQSGLCLFSLQFSGPCSWWWAWWDRQLALYNSQTHSWLFVQRGLGDTPFNYLFSEGLWHTYLFSSGLVTYGWLFVQKTPSGTQVIICSEKPQWHSWLFVQKTPSDTQLIICSENTQWHSYLVRKC